MKIFKGLLAAGVAVALLSGCGAKNEDTSANAGNQAADAVTTASLVNEADAFVNGVSEQGTWIVAILNDVTVDKDVIVAGEFHDKDAADGDIYRKIALYAQDEDHNITANYTLTVPKLTVQSENLRIQGGTVKGDVYVEANGFNLHESATVDGNIYYASEDVKATAVIDGKVTGTQEVK
ncbi:polymer-forming cytoskeletal protein [Paenibacillus sp. M1]|uniref:Polymer-forming cytoskeletal protein n=1 Tax=Paenibacillus haidiansis TaxID=1574488 RepID=A0ABU7VUG8_9BACL